MRLEHWWRRPASGTEKIDGVSALYLNNLLRSLAGSMVGIFYPLYVFGWGFERGGLILGLKVTLLAALVERGLIFLGSLLWGKAVYRLGFKFSILVASALLTIYFLLLTLLPRSLELIMILALIAAVEIPLYWLARLSILSLERDGKGFGHEVSLLMLGDRVAMILGPFSGGVLLIFGGFSLLFAVVAGLCLLSAIPLFLVKDYVLKDSISLSGFIGWFKNKKERHLHLSFWGQGWANFTEAYFWPIYIFLIVGSFTVLGGLISVSFALSSVAVYLAGRLFDQRRALGGDEDERMYQKATVVFSFLSVLRPLFKSLAGLFAIDVLLGVSLPFWGVDYDAYLYAAGRRVKSTLAFFVYREMWYSLARFIGPLILLLVVDFAWFWWVVFGMGAVGILMTWGMQKES